MPAAYVTMVPVTPELARAGVAPGDSFAAVALTSMPLNAIADSSLAAKLRDGDFVQFFAGLDELLSEDDFVESVSLETLDVRPDALSQPDTMQRLVGCALHSTRPDNDEQPFVDLILQADLLAEHSKAQQETFDQTAVKVAGGIGAGAMTAGVAVISASGVTGVVVAIVGTGGVALLGVGAAYLTYRLLTRRRRRFAT
jgi:hypothetical protein